MPRLRSSLLLSVLAAAPAAVLLWAQAPRSPAASAVAPAPAPRAATPRVVLHAAPGGDTLGVVAGTALEAVGREGGWTRVRLEGWTRARLPLAGSGTPEAPWRNLPVRALRAEPERFRGQVVAWGVEFVALQRADSLRTDFAPGEPYLLARDPDGEPGLVYVAVRPEQVRALRGLTPLQPVRLVGRVRSGRSPLMGHPVLELLELNPEAR